MRCCSFVTSVPFGDTLLTSTATLLMAGCSTHSAATQLVLYRFRWRCTQILKVSLVYSTSSQRANRSFCWLPRSRPQSSAPPRLCSLKAVSLLFATTQTIPYPLTLHDRSVIAAALRLAPHF